MGDCCGIVITNVFARGNQLLITSIT